jgi:hypothetical protein
MGHRMPEEERPSAIVHCEGGISPEASELEPAVFRRLGGLHVHISDVLPDAPQYAGRINDYEVTDAP